MAKWLREHAAGVFTLLLTGVMVFYIVACESKVRSLNDNQRLVTRQELQFELQHILDLAELRMADLDRQEQLRNLVLQNGLLILQGTPFNPVGLVTAIAAFYGIGQAGCKINKTVKIIRSKRNNG